jgi:hypothetical protein
VQEYQRHAEMLWRFSRRLLAENVDHDFDRTLRTNRTFLDQLAVELIEEMPEGIRGSGEEAEEESELGADEDDETSDADDDGPDGDSDGDSDDHSDESCEEEDEDDADHSDEEQEVETVENRLDYTPNDTTP